MDIKAVPGVPSFQVNTVTESNDEARRQNLAERNPKKRKTPAPKKPAATPKTESVDESKNDGGISRQIIDSEKVVELLSSRPPNTSAAAKYSVNFPSTKPAETFSIDFRKLNKRL
jgi:hypothetical protein